MGSRILWDLPDDEDGNVQHIGEHGITTVEVDDVLEGPDWIELSRSTGLPIAFGTTRSGRMLAVVFRQIDIDTVRPVTAFEI